MTTVSPQHVESLAAKLEEFAKGLSPSERALLLSILPGAPAPSGELPDRDLDAVSGGFFGLGGAFASAVLRSKASQPAVTTTPTTKTKTADFSYDLKDPAP